MRNTPVRLILLDAKCRGGGDPYEAEWRAFHASVVDRTGSGSALAGSGEDLKPLRVMVELMAAVAPDPAIVT